ncbi:MAG TPA: cation transporter [Ignavibacteriaceae bacterium]|jgi:divalent metal cation (Fe/Co/Zn/Cd) transporter|nr:cation transporter [Ignavibacteriaceae bacterium]
MNKLLKRALILAIITVVYNVIEGLVSVFFGAKDETLALLGFGVDSFVEVISGIGILHMVLRMKYSKVNQRDKFERTALLINGSAFYLLTLGLIAGSVLNILYDVKPTTTFAGIIISVISIGTMYYLMNAKLKTGHEMKSDAIIADANCTKTCFYLSFILLASSGLYEIFHISYFDVLGSLGIAYYAFKEGRESFEKSKSAEISCECDD